MPSPPASSRAACRSPCCSMDFVVIGKPTWLCWLAFQMCGFAQTAEPPAVVSGFGKPALIAASDLADFDSLPADRRKLIETAIAVARDSPWLPYTARGNEPADGGFDCSGAMYFVMRKAELDPPRVAAAQFQWLKRNDRMHLVPANASGSESPGFERSPAR